MTGFSLAWHDLLGPILGGLAYITYESMIKKSKKGKKGSSHLLLAGTELAVSMYIGNAATIWMSSAGLVGLTSEVLSKVIGGAIFATTRKAINDEAFGKQFLVGTASGLVGDAITYPLGYAWGGNAQITPNVNQQTAVQAAAGPTSSLNNPMLNH